MYSPLIDNDLLVIFLGYAALKCLANNACTLQAEMFIVGDPDHV